MILEFLHLFFFTFELMNYLTEEQLEDFHRDGIIVIENVLHNNEVQYFRDAFHKQLQLMGINHDKLLRFKIH